MIKNINNKKIMYGFQLGREFKLSIAEILAVFPSCKIVSYDTDVLIVDSIDEENILNNIINIGGTIKAFSVSELIGEDGCIQKVCSEAENSEGKFKYGISSLGKKKNLKTLLMKIKKSLRSQGISSRFVNKDFKSLSSAQILGEQLVKRGTDFSLIEINGKFFFGKTIWVQDINAYSKRDYAKSRDMQIGMLPPKLSQMMINLAANSLPVEKPLSPSYKQGAIKSTIYDPFVGLGTILIEAELMGFKGLYGSDLNERMVETSSSNVKNANIEKLNAKFINEVSFWDTVKDGLIVTEGYLGEVMTQKNISKERIIEQRKTLLKIYEGFFANLQKGGFRGQLVISFPFWEIRGKYFYFEEIYTLLEKYCQTLPYFPEDFDIKTTKSGSLLYKRNKQLVGREIFKLKIKKS